MFDIYKRQTKETRFQKLIESNKVFIPEEDRIEAFNRLINDANRRKSAQVHMENIKEEINNEEEINKRYYTQKEWEDIYKGRYNI